MYKKIIVIMVLIVLIVPTGFASNNIGDDIGDVLSTDIVTKINGVSINSFNINGKTAVYVAELRKLGYHVNWNGEERKVTITENYEKLPITLDTPGIKPYEKLNNNKKIGSAIADVLYTDIVTYMKGEEVKSFNINGSTAIYVDDFTRLGIELIWDANKREVKLNRDKEKALLAMKAYERKQKALAKKEKELELVKMPNYEQILIHEELPDGVILIKTRKFEAPPGYPSKSGYLYKMNITYHTEDYPSAINAKLLEYDPEEIKKPIWLDMTERSQNNNLKHDTMDVSVADSYMFVLLDENGNVLGYKVFDGEGNTVTIE